MSPRNAAPRRVLPRSPFAAQTGPDRQEFEVADRVCHDRHGLGRVVRVDSDAVIVDFGSGDVRRVLVTSTRITKL